MILFQKFIYLCLILTAVGCNQNQTDSSKSNKATLLVSIAPYRFLTERIAGSGYNIRTVVPENTNPHSYEPTSNQILDVSKGLVWFQIGEPFEEKLYPVLRSKNPKLVVQDLRDGIDLIQGCKCCSKDTGDRHIWMSPNLLIQQAKLIEETLSKRFPHDKDLFKENLTEVCRELVRLDKEIHHRLKTVKNRSILVSHPAFGYYCKDYGLRQLSVEFEGKEPRPRELQKILAVAERECMKLALAVPQHNNKGVNLIAKELKANLHSINPYSSDYLDMMRKLTDCIETP